MSFHMSFQKSLQLSLIALALSLGLSAQAIAAPVATSAYTSLEDKDCNYITSSNDDPDAEIDYFKSICPGRDGYLVKLAGGDIRSWVGLLAPGQKYDEANDFYGPLMEGSLGQFPNVQGSKLEWRYSDGKLVAFILRMIAQDPEDYEKSIETLVVVRVDTADLSKACLAGSVDVKKTPNANVAARAIADDLSKTCTK